MPRGWYLAQGLIPLGYSSSDDEEGPCELPDGRLVCGPHGLVWCGKCCVDYSFMEEVLGHNSDDGGEGGGNDDSGSGVEAEPTGWSSFSPPLKRGTGRVFPTEFPSPPAVMTPLELFSGKRNHIAVTRYTLPNDPRTGIIRTDGACLDNGQQNPKAGWAFWHGCGPSGKLLVASGRLEQKGPFGDDGEQTSNRAELRAVIAALRFRHWPGEGFNTLVIATDSEYAVRGATKWAKKWVENGWVTCKAAAVKNRDLWEVLLGEMERFKDCGMAVEFWRIPRGWNMVADAAAKEAAAEGEAPAEWMDVTGMNI